MRYSPAFLPITNYPLPITNWLGCHAPKIFLPAQLYCLSQYQFLLYPLPNTLLRHFGLRPIAPADFHPHPEFRSVKSGGVG
ncbi:hypothetical protein QT972_24620 [Microcoleus sp. herbarium7]